MKSLGGKKFTLLGNACSRCTAYAAERHFEKRYHTHAQVLDESIYEELVYIEEYANTKPPKSDTHQRRLATTHKLFTFNIFRELLPVVICVYEGFGRTLLCCGGDIVG
jgi:hypothetical protein